MEILQYDNRYAQDFVALNTAWIVSLFGQLEKRILKHSRILKGKLFMLSNSRSQAALHIYHKYGFKEIKLKDYEYERGDIAFELTVNQ